MQKRSREEKALVLDFLVNGYVTDRSPSHLKTPIAQAIGTTNFTLLELVPKKDIHLQSNQEVYIGGGNRDLIHHINGRLFYDKLTSHAKSELEHAVKQIVESQEQRFVDFFNKAMPLNTRMHILELLPGLGKKHMLEIVEQRRDEPFKNFDDIRARVKLMPDPKSAIVKRILSEISGAEKHALFVY